ncbi:tetratricopeptide repeat protein [Intrasporangium sp. YIM S08009]|uniref:tetratricopeptide repeat protein n=1 Tax=Intrasporangium zincisolvens TaxID=3080018 RepID=UPI002B058CF7|nr:tetratricopeptide repeat protein [Intrasporangium sp. YIM S08009]
MTSLLDRPVPAPEDTPRPGGRLAALRSRLPGGARGRGERSDLLPRPPQVRRRRRRLVLASLPVAVLLVLVAARLLTLNVVHDRTLDAYTAGDAERTMTWAQRQGWVNVVEQFRAPFAVGDAHILTGHYALARPWFEQAFELVPKGGIDDCKVRVNLGLTYEALGDDAKARERTDEWKQFYDKGIRITKERPPLCDAPEGGQTGDQLQQAQQRMEQKNADAPPDQGQGNEDQPQPGPTPQPTPTPDPNQTPSQEEQDYLQQQQRQNTIERNQQQGQDDRIQPGDGGQTYPKPW